MALGSAALADQPLRLVEHQPGFTAQAIRHHGHAGGYIGCTPFQGDAGQRPQAGIGIDTGQHASRRRDAIGPQQPVHAAGMIFGSQAVAKFRQQPGFLHVIQPGGIPGVARPCCGRACLSAGEQCFGVAPFTLGRERSHARKMAHDLIGRRIVANAAFGKPADGGGCRPIRVPGQEGGIFAETRLVGLAPQPVPGHHFVQHRHGLATGERSGG